MTIDVIDMCGGELGIFDAGHHLCSHTHGFLTTGCHTYSRDYRIEQAEAVEGQIYVVVSAGISASEREGGRTTFRDRRYYLLVYDAESQDCPPTQPNEVWDGSRGIGPIDLNPRVRVDFLFGAYRDWVVRIVTMDASPDRREDVAVLGRDSRSRAWTVSASWTVRDGDLGGRKPDGKAATTNRAAGTPGTATLEGPSANLLAAAIESRYARAKEWNDWKIREAESESGAIFGGPIWFGSWGGNYYVWDIDDHREIPNPGGQPHCDGFPVAVRSGNRGPTVLVLDVDTPMGERGFVRRRP